MAVHQSTGWDGRGPIAASRSKALRPEVAEHPVLKQEENPAGEEAAKLSTASRLLGVVVVGTSTKGCEIVVVNFVMPALKACAIRLDLCLRLMQGRAHQQMLTSASYKCVLQVRVSRQDAKSSLISVGVTVSTRFADVLPLGF